MGVVDKLHLKKKRSKLLINSMLVAGWFLYDLPKFDIRKYAWTVISILFLTYLFVFTLFNLTTSHEFSLVLNIIKTSLSAIMCLVVLMVTYRKRRDLMYLVDTVENHFYTYSDEENFKFVSSASELSEKITLYAIGLFYILVQTFAVLPMSMYTSLRPDVKNNKGANFSLPSTWVPFKGDTIFSFYLKNVTLHMLTLAAFTNYIGNLWLTMIVQMEFSYQFERLTYALKTIVERVQMQIDEENSNTLQVLPTTATQDHKRFENSDSLPFTVEFNEKYEAKLVECVKHYQKIADAYKKFHSWFGLVFGITLTHSVLTLAMMSYSALRIVSNLVASFRYLILFFGYLIQFYIYCYCGEKFFRMNEDFSNEIYNVEWYRQPASRRKLFYIFLCDSQKPFRMYGFVIYPASLTIFGSVMKLTYSYLNILSTYGSSK